MNVAFRLARAQDCAALTELSMRAKQSNGYGEEFMAACRAELTVTAAQLGCGEHWVIWPDDAGTAAASGTPKARAPLAYGWLNWRAGQADGEIESFFVEPSGQRSGLGRRLWRHLETRARRAGLQQLWLDADPNATGFYLSMGMRLAGQAPSASIAGRRLPRMHKRLGDSPSGKG